MSVWLVALRDADGMEPVADAGAADINEENQAEFANNEHSLARKCSRPDDRFNTGNCRESCLAKPYMLAFGVIVASPGSSTPPCRCTNHAAEIAAMEMGLLVGDHIDFDVAERSIGLVPDTVIERLDDVLLKVLGTRMGVYDGFAIGIREGLITSAEHIPSRHRPSPGLFPGP